MPNVVNADLTPRPSPSGAAGTERTPCGRIPNTPLRNARHEIIVHATVCGKTARAAGIDAGFKDGFSLDGNVTRILHRPEVRERLMEVAASSAGLAGIYSAWVLADIKLGAQSNLAHFFRRDANGNIEFDCNGLPVLDFRSASEEQMRTVSEFSFGKYGPKLKLHDPRGYLEMLARHLGLFQKDQLPTGGVVSSPIEIRLVKAQDQGD
jgi:hypothetical protein